MKYTPEEVLEYIREEDVKFIRLAFLDAYGIQKNISVMAGEVKKAFEDEIKHEVITDPNGHLFGALGIAILSHKNSDGRVYDFDIKDIEFKTVGNECGHGYFHR